MSSIFDCCNCSCSCFWGSKSASTQPLPQAKRNYGSFDGFTISPDRLNKIRENILNVGRMSTWAHAMPPLSSKNTPDIRSANPQKMSDRDSNSEFSPPVHLSSAPTSPFVNLLQERENLPGGYYCSCPSSPQDFSPENSD